MTGISKPTRYGTVGFDIVAFDVPKHRSLLYRSFLTEEQLLKAVSDSIDKGANVISIRKVVKEEG